MRVILSGVSSWAKAGRNAVEGPRRFFAILPVNARDPSIALRPPFHLRSAQDDTRFSFGHTRSKQRHLRLHLGQGLRGLLFIAGLAVGGEGWGFGDGGFAFGVEFVLLKVGEDFFRA